MKDIFGDWGLAAVMASLQSALRQISDQVEAAAAEVADRMRERILRGDSDASALSEKVVRVWALSAPGGSLQRLLRDSTVRWRSDEAVQASRITSELSAVAARAEALRLALAGLAARMLVSTETQVRCDRLLFELVEFEERIAAQVSEFSGAIERINGTVAGIHVLRREL